jgi:two-component system chemotaxis response regulator CheY
MSDTSYAKSSRLRTDAGHPVLHVDDDEQALAGLARIRRTLHASWRLTSVRSASEALEYLHSIPDAIVLTDWMMPSVDGLTLCRRIRELELTNPGYAYIILLTGKRDIANIVEALDAGADDFLAKPYDARELHARVRAGMRIVDLQRKLREANGRLEALAMRDPLTGLYNRRRGDEILAQNLDLVRRGKQDLSVILLDMNRFKMVNDEHGHDAGDRLLIAVADRIRQACRQYDAVIRWGGDEFLVVCPHTAGAEAQSVAARIGAMISQDCIRLNDGVSVVPVASAGACSLPAGAVEDAATLVAAADAAMYAAKASPRPVPQCASTNPT